MHRCFLIVFVATLSLMASAEARAAHISCEALDERFRPAYQNIYGIPGQHDKSCYSIHVTGEITKGDFEAFRDILRKGEPYVNTVTLISFGGDVN